MSSPLLPAWEDDTTQALRDVADKFFAEVVAERDRWDAEHRIDRSVWERAGSLGLLCCSIPEEYGGGGGEFTHDLVVQESQGRSGDSAFGNAVHSGIVAHYILAYGSQDQKLEWLPRMTRGTAIGAIAMTEPGAGSDLQAMRTRAVRHGETYVINGAKTFITNGQNCDVVVLAASTDPSARGKGISLFLVDAATPGFVRGRVLDKVGQHGADTSERAFEDLVVPASALLGDVEGLGFGQLMTQLVQERLVIGSMALGSMEGALAETIEHTRSRELFGTPLFDLQNTRFELAECATTVAVARAFLDSAIARHLTGDLDAATAAMVKWWMTEQQCQLIDRCVQLFGGYGYMREYTIARRYEDARVQKVYAGANEVMKDIIGRSL